jgi:hypothetical protein
MKKYDEMVKITLQFFFLKLIIRILFCINTISDYSTRLRPLIDCTFLNILR